MGWQRERPSEVKKRFGPRPPFRTPALTYAPADMRNQPRPPLLSSGLLFLLTWWMFTPNDVQAQSNEEFQQWTAVLSQVRLAEEEVAPALWLDLHSRRGVGQNLLIVRPGVGLHVADWLSLWVGYAWIPRFPAGLDDTHEHRVWQQGTLTHRPAPGVLLVSRSRLEQRFSDAGSDVGVRFRQFVRGNWQPDGGIPIGLGVWDELFVGFNDTDWGAVGGYDQNRVFVGPFVGIQDWGRFELGYLWTLLRRGGQDLHQHVLAANLFVSLTP